MTPVSTSMVVVDTNVVVYLLLPTEFTEQARQALLKNSQWAAPLLWRSEFRQVLTRYVNNQHITLGSALKIQAAAEQLFAGREFAVDSASVMNTAAASGCSAYDSEFIVVAKLLGVPLVTNDNQLLHAFPETAISPENFVSGK